MQTKISIVVACLAAFSRNTFSPYVSTSHTHWSLVTHKPCPTLFHWGKHIICGVDSRNLANTRTVCRRSQWRRISTVRSQPAAEMGLGAPSSKCLHNDADMVIFPDGPSDRNPAEIKCPVWGVSQGWKHKFIPDCFHLPQNWWCLFLADRMFQTQTVRILLRLKYKKISKRIIIW